MWTARFMLLPSKKGETKKNLVECVQLYSGEDEV